MAFLSFQNIGIAAVSTAVPSTVIENRSYTEYFSAEDVAEIVDKTGVERRRFADENTCASDLCYAAAIKLFEDNNVALEEVGALIFISQTPDYRMPATSVILQSRLGLPKSTFAFDINLGCSAFVYGLSVAYSLLQGNPSLGKVLILNGETRSKVYSPKDRQTAFIFGDAGAAILIEADERFGKSYFSLNTDGSKEDFIKIPAGGYRKPSDVNTVVEEVVDEYGNIRTEEHGYMKGSDVFTFVLKEIPSDIKQLLNFSGSSLDDIDQYMFHQANVFINSYLIKKLKLDKAKVPWSISEYGNTSSVSIPLTLGHNFGGSKFEKQKVLFSAFGVGMSWASAILSLDNCYISNIKTVG